MACVIDKLARTPVETMDQSVDIQQAAAFMAGRDTGAVVVTDAGRVLGLFTERDLIRRVVGAGRDPREVTLGEVCSRDLIGVAEGTSCEDAIKTMHANACRRLLLYRGAECIGVVTLPQVAQEMAEQGGRRNTLINLVGGVTLVAAVCVIALWLYQLPEMARLAMQVMK